MAIHDRDYMRDDPAAAWTAPRSATLWILVVQVAAMVAFAVARESAGRSFEGHATFGLDALRGGRVWTVVTHVFIDTFSFRWMLDAAMWWFFGRMAEEALGRARFLGFLAAALVAGCAVHVVAAFAGAPPRFAPGAMHGLTALTAACLVHAAFRDPGRPVWLFFAEVPLRVFALLCVALEVAVAFGHAVSGGESVAAILGAAGYGIAAWKLGLVPGVRAWRALRGRGGPRRAAADDAATPAQIDARVDEILDKISTCGMPSLTAEEREFLQRASKRR